jgi:molybdopterin molybdotransferase
MITLKEAQTIVAAHTWRLGTERVPLDAALWRVLAEDVHADLDMPPFDKAAVDGYACRLTDAANEMEVIEEVPAGAAPTRALGPGQCTKIMTGAPMPIGADGVIMVEHTRESRPGFIQHTGQALRPNHCKHGEDMRTGDQVLTAGTRLLPQHLAVLATVGAVRPLVSRVPRVGVLATGSELVPANETPSGAHIRNCNSHQLAAQVRTMGAHAKDYGIVHDDPDELRAAMARAIAENDVVLSSGGVSMGDYDLVPGLVAELGLEIHVRKVAIQPGKPIVFATGHEKAYFGLSGNPMSGLVQFELFVRAFLMRLQGAEANAVEIWMPLGETMRRKLADRMAFVPVRLRDGQVWPVAYHGSAHINALTVADGLIAYAAGETEIETGRAVRVWLLRH